MFGSCIIHVECCACVDSESMKEGSPAALAAVFDASVTESQAGALEQNDVVAA